MRFRVLGPLQVWDGTRWSTIGELELGRHAGVVSELAGLVGENPLRERLRVLYMLALYRCGRRADALEAYRDARRLLIEELGIEPGPELRDLEQAILHDDTGLQTPAQALDPAARTKPDALGQTLRPGHRRRRGRGRLRDA